MASPSSRLEMPATPIVPAAATAERASRTAAASAGGARGVMDMPDSIERMFDEQRVVNACGRGSGARLAHAKGGQPFGDEYEYWITVPSKDIPTIIEALDGQPG